MESLPTVIVISAILHLVNIYATAIPGHIYRAHPAKNYNKALNQFNKNFWQSRRQVYNNYYLSSPPHVENDPDLNRHVLSRNSGKPHLPAVTVRRSDGLGMLNYPLEDAQGIDASDAQNVIPQIEQVSDVQHIPQVKIKRLQRIFHYTPQAFQLQQNQPRKHIQRSQVLLIDPRQPLANPNPTNGESKHYELYNLNINKGDANHVYKTSYRVQSNEDPLLDNSEENEIPEEDVPKSDEELDNVNEEDQESPDNQPERVHPDLDKLVEDTSVAVENVNDEMSPRERVQAIIQAMQGNQLTDAEINEEAVTEFVITHLIPNDIKALIVFAESEEDIAKVEMVLKNYKVITHAFLDFLHNSNPLAGYIQNLKIIVESYQPGELTTIKQVFEEDSSGNNDLAVVEENGDEQLSNEEESQDDEEYDRALPIPVDSQENTCSEDGECLAPDGRMKLDDVSNENVDENDEKAENDEGSAKIDVSDENVNENVEGSALEIFMRNLQIHQKLEDAFCDKLDSEESVDVMESILFDVLKDILKEYPDDNIVNIAENAIHRNLFEPLETDGGCFEY